MSNSKSESFSIINEAQFTIKSDISEFDLKMSQALENKKSDKQTNDNSRLITRKRKSFYSMKGIVTIVHNHML